MSDLASFVAAVLRDKVIHELEEEIKQFKQETEYWTVRLMESTGSPVAAIGKLSQREVLRQHIREEHDCRDNIGIHTPLKGQENWCATFRNLCERVKFEITTSCGRKISFFIKELEPRIYIEKKR